MNIPDIAEDKMTMTGVEEREAKYWDEAASRVSDADLELPIRTNDPLNSARRSLLGDIAGLTLLDVGCGTGGWSVFLASCGAEVWAIDISPQSVEATMRRSSLHGVDGRVHACVMSATEMDYPDGYFDVVHGQDIIHHLDASKFGIEISRVLAPGGHAVFVENCANNPVLMFARNRLCGRWGIPKWSSDDEYPLTRERIAEFAASFDTCDVSYPYFRFFALLDAKIFGYKNKLINRMCNKLDQRIYDNLPRLRPMSYRQILRCRK